MKRLLVLMLCFALFLGGCRDGVPMCVTFKNQTPLFSTKNAITVVFSEDKRVRDMSVDLLLKSVHDNFACKITRELGQSYEIFMPNAGQWYSFAQMTGQTPSPMSEVETTTFIFETSQAGNLGFKAVLGEAEDVQANPTGQLAVSKEVYINLF